MEWLTGDAIIHKFESQKWILMLAVINWSQLSESKEIDLLR